jgi:transcriptional regulator with XRE-family HTH domain
MFSMNDLEVQKLLKLLDQAIHESRRSRREIERSLGLGQGYLSSLFRGRIELKVWHVYRLARELGHDPLKFFFKVSPPEDPKWVQEHLGLAPEVARAKRIEKAPPPLGPTLDMLVTRGELDNLVRRTIREELARIKDDDPEEPEEEPDESEDPYDPEEPE